MIKYTIYMATNTVNGKRYVGITKRGLAARKKRHLYLARKGDDGCSRLYDAIRKYGEDSFVWQSIATADTEKEAFRIERALIKKIRRFSEEYNITDGGEGGRSSAPLSEETRERLREIGLTKESKERFALYSHLGSQSMARKVVCLNTGNVFESASAAARNYGIAKSLVIEVCLRNKRRKTAGGLIFRYFGDHLGGRSEVEEVILERNAGRRSYGKACAKPIICTTYGIRFSGSLAASIEYCIGRSQINAVCRGDRGNTFGLKFKYTDGGI